MRLLLQFPEGLKREAQAMASSYEKEGHEVFLSASACYGACDLALDEARAIGADKIIHVGHNRFIRKDLPIEVEYSDHKIDIDVGTIAKALPLLERAVTIAIATTVQHTHQLPQIKLFLEERGKKVLIGRGKMAFEPGQVLGCDGGAISSVIGDADAALYVGSGLFHPLAIDIEGDKMVIALNPYTGTATDLRPLIEQLRRKRRGALAAALSARSWGILLSTKPGQMNLAGATRARDQLRKRGLEADILVANELDPMSIGNFMRFDCLLNTACPRLADDSERYGKPVLGLGMLGELLSMLESQKG